MNDWVVPKFMGHVHLTKPPLVYWLESASINLLGTTYFAVRVPSAISGTLAILLLYWFTGKVFGRREAVYACGLYAIMPLTIFPARMTVTDSVLNLCWLMVIFGGYLVRSGIDARWIGRVLLAMGMSLGLLAKGPVMLIPLGIVLVWWGLTPGETTSRRVKVGYALGSVAVLVPLVAWGVDVILSVPDALGVWRHETLDRAVGQGDHSRPIWYFIPVLIVGCFPSSAMLMLPGVNIGLRESWARFTSGSIGGYLGFAIIAPFLVYSLISGKLPSYLLPICAPLAIMNARMLMQWFDHQRPQPGAGVRLPEVRVGLMVGTILFMLCYGGVVVWFYGAGHAWFVAGLLPAFLVAVLLVRSWRIAATRAPLIACFILAWVVGWLSLEEVEDIALQNASYGAVSLATFGPGGWDGRVGVYQLDAGIIYWERSGVLELYASPDELGDTINGLNAESLLVLTRADRWNKLQQIAPELYRSGRVVREWQQYPGAPVRYLVVYNMGPVE